MKPLTQTTFDAYFYTLNLAGPMHLSEHSHDGYEIIYMTSGSMNIYVEKKHLKAGTGHLVVYHPHEIHRETFLPGEFSHICLRFPESCLPQDVEFPSRNELPHVIDLVWKDKFRGLMEQIVLEHKGIDRWSHRLRDICFSQFIMLLHRAIEHSSHEAFSLQSDNVRKVNDIIQIINNCDTNRITMDEISRNIFMSKSHLGHVFKRITGVSPKNYVIRNKMQKSCELLLHSTKSIVEISKMMDFSTPAYFNRMFKKKFGITPGEYRKKGFQNP
ncbi:MAG: AraC family transcriptional regulator [Spirochaetales bacterium]|nr:AraC family transcriptional regulator [Spirochaetales bacterium]